MIAPTPGGCKGRWLRICRRREPFPGKNARHGIVSGIIIPPYFRPPPAVLNCENILLRWPGPFGPGFLSPQPPGVVGIGPVRRIVYPTLGQRKLVLFLFGGVRCRERLASFRRKAKTSEPDNPAVIGARVRARATRTENDRSEEVSAATCRPRRASDRACRGCHPGHRPPRHRRLRGKYFPVARSSCRRSRSSRLP
jgi:hypothetical protein